MRPELDGRQVMEHLGVPPGPVVGQALEFLLELRLDEGPLGEEEAYRRLDAWWEKRKREERNERGGRSSVGGIRRRGLAGGEGLHQAVASSSWNCTGGDFMKYAEGPTSGPPTPRSRASLAQRTASMITPAEFGESHTSSLSSRFRGTSPKLRPSMRM